MPATDILIFENSEDVKQWRKDLKAKHDRCVNLANSQDFLSDDGTIFRGALADYRTTAIIPVSSKPSPEGGGEGNYEQIQVPAATSGPSLPTMILASVAIGATALLGIYRVLSGSIAALVIFAALFLFLGLSPLLAFIKQRSQSETSAQELDVIDSIFHSIYELIPKAIHLRRIVYPVEDGEEDNDGGPYHDALFVDLAKQTMMQTQTEIIDKLGTIYNISEKALHSRNKLLLDTSAKIASGSALQPLRPQTKS